MLFAGAKGKAFGNTHLPSKISVTGTEKRLPLRKDSPFHGYYYITTYNLDQFAVSDTVDNWEEQWTGRKNATYPQRLVLFTEPLVVLPTRKLVSPATASARAQQIAVGRRQCGYA
jgi:hypothetical protein